jgi:hypothetical protein
MYLRNAPDSQSQFNPCRDGSDETSDVISSVFSLLTTSLGDSLMKDTSDRVKFLRAIQKCLSDAHGFFNDAMESLDEIGKASVGTGMTPLVGGYAMKDPKQHYRKALIKIDAAEKSLAPLAKRMQDGRVNETHFKNSNALVMLNDLTSFDYKILLHILSERRGRESVWYRLRELSETAEKVFNLVAEE